MTSLKSLQLFALSVLVFASSGNQTRAQETFDIVIYGPTSAGISAAIAAKRLGKSVVIVGPDQHLGGLSASGLGWTDSGKKEVIGGISREFYQRVKQVYDQESAWKWQSSNDYGRYRRIDDAQWTFEPSVAESVFEKLVSENEIRVDRNEWLDRSTRKGVLKHGTKIHEIRMLSGKSYRGKVFIDATYEGDLMAAAGVSFTVGREPNSKYGETLNGVQFENDRHHQFEKPVDPYIVPGQPESGLLPRIQEGDPGKQGEGDDRIQAYNYRVCLTRVAENRVPFPKPKGYDARQYELLLRVLKTGSEHFKGKFDMLPNLKTDTNNHGSFSTDNIGMNYDYPTASYKRRQEILAEHRQYQMGYFYFIANDERVPEKAQKWISQWGLAKDEFADNEHWPHQIYVREARRMVSDFVVTELHLRGTKPTQRSIAMGSYNMDSHHTQRYVDKDGHVRNEGDVQIKPGGPYPIDFGAIIPKRNECTNLLVPVCVSASHIAYGSIRMEPVFMALGQSASTAASLLIDNSIAVQDVKYSHLRKILESDRQVLEFQAKPAGINSKSLNGLVVDDAKAHGVKNWFSSKSQRPFVDFGYRHDNDAKKGDLKATFAAKIPQTGKYDVRISWTAHPNRASNVPVSIKHSKGRTNVTVNQKKKPNSNDFFQSLGTYHFDADTVAEVIVSNKDTDGHVIIDAVQWLPN